MTANAKGADLVVIGVINYSSPTCFISKTEDNITKPKDFEGKTVGILTGTNTEYVYQALINKASVNREKINEIKIPFNLATFITGQYDVRPAFIYDETVSLDANDIDYQVIEPKNYGVHFLGTVYFTQRKTIVEKPELVQSFVNAIADGWKIALSDPEKSIQYLKSYDNDIDANRELASLKKGLPYFQGQNSKILFAEKEEWIEMISILNELNILNQEIDLDSIVNYSFIENYHSANQ